MSTETQSVLVTGANGYIGAAVARAFRRAGYVTYGLVRSSRSAPALEQQSIIPIIGSASDSNAIVQAVKSHTTKLDILVSTTEDQNNYVAHFQDTLQLLRKLAEYSNAANVRPLVLFTSGCKDYGRGDLDGTPYLAPHTEDTTMNPPSFLADRAKYSVKVLDEPSFDAVVFRPTNVHGYSSSYYGLFFHMTAQAKAKDQPLLFKADSRTILHSLHIDDCGEAYVAVAEHGDRQQVAGQIFNISAGKRYETLREVADSLTYEYQLEKSTVFEPVSPVEEGDPLVAFSQWVGSEKIRKLTGWKEKRPLFAEGIHRYRIEYEDAVSGKDENVDKIRDSYVSKLAGTGH